MICIDSDCIIDFLKGEEKAIKILKEHRGELLTTEINAFEILFGIYNKKEVDEIEENIALNFLDSVITLPFDLSCGQISAKILASLIKQGKIIDQNDCFIASIMIKNGCNEIITRNEKHFSRIKNLQVISY